MENINNIENKVASMTMKDWAKTGLKAIGVLTGIQIGREVGSQTTPFTGFVCGVAVGDMMVRSSDTIVDSAVALKEKFFGPGFVTKIPGEEPEATSEEVTSGMTPDNYGVNPEE